MLSFDSFFVCPKIFWDSVTVAAVGAIFTGEAAVFSYAFSEFIGLFQLFLF